MAFYVNNVNYCPGIYPPPTNVARGSFLVAATTTEGFWAYPGNSKATPSGALETRSIFTHGYVAGGYKDSNPWRSVNKTWHSNDVTIYIGEQLQKASAYSAGTFSDYNGYVHGATGNFEGAGTDTSSYSLATGVARTQAAGWAGANPGGPFGYTGNNPVADGSGIVYGSTSVVGTGSWDTSVSRTYFAGEVNQLGQVGYIAGGSQTTVVDKFYMPTEIMYTTTSHTGSQSSHATAAHGSTIGWWSFNGALRYQTYSNDSWAVWSPGVTISTDGVTKALSTKKGYHYCGTSSNVTVGFAKWSDSTGSVINGSLSKPSALGEENMEMGQEWGYCLGQYNGQQNNYTFKVMYGTDVMTVLGTTSQPKGHAGMSSALCSSAASSVVMNYI